VPWWLILFPVNENRVEYRPISLEDYEAVRRFLCEMGWEKRVADAARFRRMMEKADRTVVAFDDRRVVGFARALCDGVSNGYISMVAVAPDRRGQGIGRELVSRLIGEDRGITWVLRAGRGSRGFWEKLGFKMSETAMEKIRET
jgi:GNAT superfamily N-acetyltransferase